MSTAKTLAASLGVPLVAVGTLDMEAHPYATVSPAVAAVIGAGRNRLYIGRYGAASTHASPEYDVIASDMLAAMIAPGTLLCGEAALESVGLLTGALASQVKIVHRPPPTRSMSVMAELGHSKLLSGHVEDPASLQPTYLRSSQVNMANQAWAVKQP
jgi:tRNA A37 threonylcarbamoyladenosine modification protein TsaB